MVKNDKYGIKQVANAVFYDLATGKPVMWFNSLKTSSIENASESAQATGGQGGGALVDWDYGRTTTLAIQDALLSDKSLAMLAGTTVKTEGIVIHARETFKNVTDTLTLKQTPIEGKITVFKSENGAMMEEVTTFTEADKVVTFAPATSGDLEVYYQYEARAGSANQVTFSADKFPGTYKVVGDTLTRNTNNQDEAMQFVIHRAKLQSGFTLTMDVENVSTFDFNLNAMADPITQNIYDVIRYED